mmetsp:Transcript_49213/g.119261  ORF Transcript_49213/g.119261 Transcript_49213/m.119261 type:complete len:1022 (-) Transcript_49213:130-3195(-)
MKFFNRNKKNKNRMSSTMSSSSGGRRRPDATSTTVQATTTTTTSPPPPTTTVGTARTNVHARPSSSAAAPVLPAPPVLAAAQSNVPSSSTPSSTSNLSNNINPFDEHDFTTTTTNNNNNNNNAYESNNPTRRSPSLSSSASSASDSASASSSPPIPSSHTIRNLGKPTTSSMAILNLDVVLEELSKQVRQTRNSHLQKHHGRRNNDVQQQQQQQRLSEIDTACRHIVDSMTFSTQRRDPNHHLELQCEGSRALSLLFMHTFGDDDDDDGDGDGDDVHVVSSGGRTGTGTTTATTWTLTGTKEQNDNNNNNSNIHSIHNNDESLKTEAVMIFRRYGVIPTLFQAMERYPDEDELQDHAMAAVAALSRFWDKYYSYYRAEEDDDDDDQIVGHDDVSYLEIVLEAMDEYPAHERIPSNGLVILSNVAKAVVCRILLQEKRRKQKQEQQQRQTNDTLGRDSFPRTLTNAIPTVLQILKDYRDNAEMYEKGLSALVHLTSMNPDGQMILSRQPQAVSVLIKALSAGSSDEKSDRFGNSVGVDDDQDIDDDFFAASNYNATTRSSIVDLDDDYDLMIQKKNIRLFSLQVLQNISSHPSLEVKGKIILQGGVTSIVRVLREIATMPPPIEATSTNSPYPGASFEEVKRLESSASQIMVTAATSSATGTIIACLRTLVYLSSLSSGSTTTGSSSAYDENRRVLAKTSTKIVLAIVRQYNVVSSTDAHEILIQSFRFFRNLSMASFDGRTRGRNISPVGAETLTSHGGISTILVCMREHTSHAMIQIQACSTIANLLLFTNNTPGGYDIIQSFNAESGISTMFETIRLHQANLVVLEQAFSALYYLVCSRDLLPDQKHQLLLEENLLVILATMQQYVDESESLCVRGCGIVLLLSAFAGSRNSTAKDSIVAVGGIDVVLATMRRHGLNTEIQEYGSGFLRGICLDSKYHDEFVEKEGISAIVSAMIVHPTEAAIQAYGCDCFIHIANANPQYRKFIKDADGLSIAHDALSNHATHNAVQTRGVVLVSLLS